MRSMALLILCVLSVSCYHVERNCTEFKTGTFTFEATSGTEIFTTKIIRKDSIEIEYFNKKVDTATIRWLNDCEYVLRKLNPKNMAEKKAIHIKILTTSENSYTFEFNEVGRSVKSRATAYRQTN